MGRVKPLVVVLSTALACKPSPAGPATEPPQRPAAASSPDDAIEGEQAWVGAVALPGVKLYIGVRLTRTEDGAWRGTIDIPAQFVAEAALDGIAVSSDELQFSLRPAGAPVGTFTLAIVGEQATGVLAQGGGEFPVSLRRVAASEVYAVGPNRPQHPHPPFPYTTRDVEFTSKDGTRLAGTITLPNGDGPFPGVVLMSGSGPQDRNEALADHKPFLVLADHLTRNGVAVLRYDDRGVPMSGGTYATSTLMDFVDDGIAAAATLRKEASVAKVGVIGHSQGAVEAAIVGVKAKSTAFVIMLAGFGLPGRDLLLLQNEVILERSAVPPEQIEKQLSALRALLDALDRGADDAELEKLGTALVELQVEEAKRRGAAGPAPTTDGLLTTLKAPWFRSVLQLEPRKWLKRLRKPPVLVGDRKQGQPGSGRGEHARDRRSAARRGKQGRHAEDDGGPQSPLPARQDRPAAGVRRDRGDHGPGGARPRPRVDPSPLSRLTRAPVPAARQVPVDWTPVADASDAVLLAAWSEGDRSAGEELFERHFEAVARFFRNKADDPIDDLIQKTFLGCLEARDSFRGEGSFRGFLFGVARNVLGKHWRSKARDRLQFDGDEVSVHELGASPSSAYAKDQEQLMVLSALRRIPIDYQVVLELHYWESMTAAEIGTALSIPVGTAKNRIRRAKQMLEGELRSIADGRLRLEPTQSRLDTWARSLRATLFR